MTIPPMKDMTGRPAAELNGSVATSPIPTGTFVRVTGDEMTGVLQLKPATGNAWEIFDASNTLNAFATPAGAIHAQQFAGDGTLLTGLVLDADVGIAGGVAALDGGGKVPLAQLPAFSLVDVFTVASQAAMLALSTANPGDIAIRTDTSTTFVLGATPASTLANWHQLLSPTGVVSFNGRTGTVLPTSGDYDAIYDVRYLQLTGDTMTGPISIVDPTAAHVPLTIRGATSQTGNLTEWKNNTPAVVASVSPTGFGTFAGLQANGNVTITGNLTVGGTVTYSHPDLIINPGIGASGANALGVLSGQTGTGFKQSYTGLDEQGALTFRGGLSFSAQTDPASMYWRDSTGTLGAVHMQLTPAQSKTTWSDAFAASWIATGGAGPLDSTHNGNFLKLDGCLVIGGDGFRAPVSGAYADMPTMIVQLGPGTQQNDIIRFTTNGIAPNGVGGGTAISLAGVRRSGNFWQVSAPPAHSNSAGQPGEMAWDATYEYRCLASASWQRTARGTGTW